MSKRIILNIGIPASGKTTTSKQFIAKNPDFMRVSRDDFRFMFNGLPILEPKAERALTGIVQKTILSLIDSGYNVVVDQTNVKRKYLNEMIGFCQELGDVEFRIFDVPLQTAIERDKKRDKMVGEDVIKKMYKDYLTLMDSNFDFSVRKKIQHKTSSYKIVDNDLPKAFIFDVDGTLAHNTGKRSFYEWDKVELDEYDEHVGGMLKFLSNEYKIIIVTGRDGSCEEQTKTWLLDNGIHWDEFFIRKTGDMRKDYIVKEEIYMNNIIDNYNVIGVFDDRDQVVSYWRDVAGLKCYQVEYGNF